MALNLIKGNIVRIYTQACICNKYQLLRRAEEGGHDVKFEFPSVKNVLRQAGTAVDCRRNTCSPFKICQMCRSDNWGTLRTPRYPLILKKLTKAKNVLRKFKYH